jgi:hypothetical protein
MGTRAIGRRGGCRIVSISVRGGCGRTSTLLYMWGPGKVMNGREVNRRFNTTTRAHWKLVDSPVSSC